MSKQGERWIQRFNNYQKALTQLGKGVELASERELTDLEKEGVIQRFKYTQELAGNVVKDFYVSLGDQNTQGSRDAFQLAFEHGLITSGKELLDSINTRNKTSHAYNREKAEAIFHDIVTRYYGAFEELRAVLLNEKKQRNL